MGACLLRSVACVLALLVVGVSGTSARQDGRAAPPDVTETLAVRAVLLQLLTSSSPSAALARLGLDAEDEQVVRGELVRYGEQEMPLRERSEGLARAYVTSPKSEDQQARLAIEAQRAALRSETHARILERLSADGRSRWLARIGEARKQLMVGPALENNTPRLSRDVRRAAMVTVTGRLRHVTCSPVLTLDVDTGTARLRLIIEDPALVSVLGKSSASTMLECGGQDVPVRIGFDAAPAATDGVAGVVRVIDYRLP